MRTKGGEHDTEVNEFTVRPYGFPSVPEIVATVIPVAKRAQLLRNRSGSTVIAGWGDLDNSLKPILSWTWCTYRIRLRILLSVQWEDSLIKLDIINEVVARTGITKTKAEMAVETVFESMKRALGNGERIELRGFGIFNVRPRKTGIGRNPRTGAEVAIPPGKAVRFKPGKELQQLQ